MILMHPSYCIMCVFSTIHFYTLIWSGLVSCFYPKLWAMIVCMMLSTWAREWWLALYDTFCCVETVEFLSSLEVTDWPIADASMNEPETPCISLTTRPVRALYIKSETRLVDVSSQALAARLEITYWKCLVYWAAAGYVSMWGLGAENQKWAQRIWILGWVAEVLIWLDLNLNIQKGAQLICVVGAVVCKSNLSSQRPAASSLLRCARRVTMLCMDFILCK